MMITAYFETLHKGHINKGPVQVSVVHENLWSTLFSLNMPISTEGVDRLQVTCVFSASEGYFLNHDREIISLNSNVSPPFPVGCFLVIREGDWFYQIDLPKCPHLILSKQGDKISAQFIIQDRFRSGLILWGDHKVGQFPIEKEFYVRANKVKSLQEVVWLEPYPNGARSVICLTEHPDFDTVPKLHLLAKLFSENNIRITKSVFPKSDPYLGKMEPGLDVPDYKNSIDMLFANGSEIAYHGLSPRTNPPPYSECLRRIEFMGMYSPKTWIDHGCGSYLFSKSAMFKEGTSLIETLNSVGIKNYWSYADVWENPARHLDVWTHRSLSTAFSDFYSFLKAQKNGKFSLKVYYFSSLIKNFLFSNDVSSIINKPWKMNSWKYVFKNSRRLRHYHENPMVLYDLSGQSCFLSSQNIWVFDTILLNHLAAQLRPSNIDLLCQQNGLLLAHCYFGHQNRHGVINCFANGSSNLSLVPEFIDNVQYISEKQHRGELVTLPFNTFRTVLADFTKTSLVRMPDGWEIKGSKAIVGCREPRLVRGAKKQWQNGKFYCTEVEGRSFLQISA